MKGVHLINFLGLGTNFKLSVQFNIDGNCIVGIDIIEPIFNSYYRYSLIAITILSFLFDVFNNII